MATRHRAACISARSARRLAAAILLTATALLLLPSAPADAHASLEETAPVDGAVVDGLPAEISLSFNEPVSVPPSGVRVFDSDGERVDTGAVSQPAGDGTVVTVAVEGDTVGTHVVTYRVTSADGHPIKGAFVFSVGSDTGLAGGLVGSLLESDDTVAATLGVLLRWLTYAGVLVLAGMALLVVAARRPGGVPSGSMIDGELTERGRRGVQLAAGTGLVATLVAVPVQTMLVTGFGPVEAIGALGDTLASSVGQAAIIRIIALLGVFALARAEYPRWPGILGAGSVAALSFLVDGHTRTAEPVALMLASDAAHVGAAAAWIGGIVLLFLVVRAARRADDPVGAARVAARFSLIATGSLILVTVAGLAMSWVTVRATRALTSTTYGWTLVTKTVLVAVVAAAGAYNHRRLVPAVEAAGVSAGGATDVVPEEAEAVPADADAAWRRLGRTTRWEAVVMSVVLLVTGVLVNLQPAADEAGVTGAYSVYEPFGDGEINLVVDPNRADVTNEIHLYLLDETGRPLSDVQDITLRLSLPSHDIGPIERVPESAGPGHWVLAGPELSLPGQWVIAVTAGIDRFTEESIEIPVTVNR